jgi:hypothetical protein
MKRLFAWLLFVVNLLLLIALQWGDALTGADSMPHAPKEVHSEQVHLTHPPEGATSDAADDASDMCQTWGEFSGSTLARAERMLGEQIPHRLWNKRYIERSQGYWVYIPPMSPAMQVKRAAELRITGVTDFFVVKDIGPLQGAISLGMFKQRDVAEKLLIRLGAKGVKDARLEPYVTRNTYAVFEIGRLKADEQAAINSLGQQFKDSRLTREHCTSAGSRE